MEKRRREERRAANTGVVKYTCNPSSEGAKMNESLGATGAPSRPRDPTRQKNGGSVYLRTREAVLWPPLSGQHTCTHTLTQSNT